jgi:hypothetical protein
LRDKGFDGGPRLGILLRLEAESMRKLETEPIRNKHYCIVPLTPGLEQDLEYYFIEKTGFPEPRIHALIEKMRTVVGVRDLCEVFIQPQIDFSQPEPDPTKRPRPSPEKAFMDLMIYILENL